MRTFRLASQRDRERIHMAVDDTPADGKWKVKIVKVISNRSDAQNRLYWQWVAIIADHCGYRKDEMHESLVQSLLLPEVKEVRGKNIYIWPSTAKMKVGDFAQYLNDIEILAADELGVLLPKPMDEWHIIQGKRG